MIERASWDSRKSVSCQVEAVIPETAPDAARDENEIHDVDPPDEKEDATDDERHDEKDEQDERDDAKTDRKDDPQENVDTVEQANIASEYGVDAHSKGDMKHELNEEKEILDLHGNPEEETARELVDESSNDPQESEIVEAKEDPDAIDAPHTDSTEHPSNEDPVERSSPSHRCDFDIPDLERMSISPRGSLGPEQQRVQKVQRDDRVPDPESKEREMAAGKGCDTSENKTTSSVLKKQRTRIWLERFAKNFLLSCQIMVNLLASFGKAQSRCGKAVNCTKRANLPTLKP